MYQRNRYPRRNIRRIKSFNPINIINKKAEVFTPDEPYQATHSFANFAISPSLKQNIQNRNFTEPTPIQDQAIPEILNHKDVVGIANTGTGKTAAFLIPLINKVISNKSNKVLVIAPTRELAVQIETEFKLLAKNLNIYSTICIGGVSLGSQIHRLRQNPSFVIGTPGRLLDLSNQRKIKFSDYNSIVLDEVDKMLDMGFIIDVEKIISQLPHLRQSLFFSATIDDKVIGIMKRFTKNPVTISVKSQDSIANVDQEIVKTSGKPKLEILRELLNKDDFAKVLIFGRTKHGIDRLATDLSKFGFQVSSIHGNKSQNQRQRSLDSFRQGRINILLATDVVSRGIDVNNISHVINYDLPESYEDYFHRIGRTGRAGKKGTALTFVD